MKLARNNPCCNSSAIHCASLTSVLRPGTALICWALTSSTSKWASRMLKTGFQYSPVLSMATCVHLASNNQSESASKSRVMVLKLRTSCCQPPCGVGVIRQATTVFLWTSNPAQ